LLSSSTWARLALFGLLAAFGERGLFQRQTGSGAFYTVVPYLAMVLPALLFWLFAIGVMLAGAFAFAKDIGATRTQSGSWRAALAAAGEALGLRYLRGGTGGGCYYPSERTSNTRLVL